MISVCNQVSDANARLIRKWCDLGEPEPCWNNAFGEGQAGKFCDCKRSTTLFHQNSGRYQVFGDVSAQQFNKIMANPRDDKIDHVYSPWPSVMLRIDIAYLFSIEVAMATVGWGNRGCSQHNNLYTKHRNSPMNGKIHVERTISDSQPCSWVIWGTSVTVESGVGFSVLLSSLKVK